MTYPFVPAAARYGLRKGPVKAFIVHMAEGGGTVGFLAKPNARGVSVHYVVESTGRIVQMVREIEASGSINPNDIRTSDDADGFYGASVAKAVMGDWWKDPNSAAITCEVEGFAKTGPNAAQHGSLKVLSAELRTRYPGIGLLGHRDFQDYKACPGKLVHWDDIGGHGPAQEADVTPLAPTSEVAQEVQVKAGTPYFDLDGTTKLGPGPTADLDWRPSPYSVIPGWHSIYATVDNLRRLVLVKPSNVRNVAPAANCDAQRDKDKAAMHAAVEGVYA